MPGRFALGRLTLAPRAGGVITFEGHGGGNGGLAARFSFAKRWAVVGTADAVGLTDTHRSSLAVGVAAGL